MSRGFTVAVLAVLVGCLAVMSYVIRPRNPNEPDRDIGKKQKEIQAANAREVSDRTHMANAMHRKDQPAAEPVKKVTGITESKPHMPNPPSGPPKRAPGQMNITADWYRTRPDGTKGLEALQKEQEQLKKDMELQKKSGVPAPATTPKRSSAHVPE